jgi:uncharacterized phiE125 gp8 family phage protein
VIAVAYKRTVDPVLAPLTVDEAKQQARIEGDDSNALLHGYVAAATDAAEQALNYGLLTQTWRCDLSSWADVIHLPMARQLQSVTHVKYYDTDGTLQTLSSSYYTTDTMTRPARLVRAADYSWPSLQADRLTGRIQITYVVGWTSRDQIPARIVQGIRMYVTYLDADRDGMDVQAQAALASAERCWSDRVYLPELSCA